MKATLRIIIFALIGFFQIGMLKASHMKGATLAYECVNACTTRVHLHAYRDCAGSNVMVTNIFWRPAAPGCALPTTVGNLSPQVTTELTPICPTATTACTTPGATVPGLQEYYWYRDYEVCAAGPCSYNITYTECCRNPTVTSLSNPGLAAIFVDAFITTGLSSCNNSPQFLSSPNIFIAQGQPVSLSFAAHDQDGDSLAYELLACRHDSATIVNYASGYSATAPMGGTWTANFDAHTGTLQLDPNPGDLVVGVVCVAVKEYRNGQLIGRIMRDYMITVYASPNNQTPVIGQLSNLSSGATLLGNEIYLCNPGTVCFDIAGADLDPANNLKFAMSQNLAGATFTDLNTSNVVDTILGTGANPPSGRFCFTPTALGTYYVQFYLRDDACPLNGVTARSYAIHVGQGIPTATATLGTCPTVNFSVQGCGNGSFTYAWSGAGGFSSTAQNPSFSYASPGTYPWQVIVSNGTASDTILGSVVANFPVAPQAILGGGFFVAPCFGTTYDTLDGGSYSSYLWSTGATTPQLVVSQAGSYGLTVTDASGCQFSDVATVVSAAPNIEGHVQTSTGAPMINQKIYLVLHDSINQALYALDSFMTDQTGYFFFCNVTDTLVFLKAAPNATDYPNEMPTYADASLFWSGAITFRPLTQSPFIHDFATLFGSNPGGPGFIGGLISQGANKMTGIGDPVPNLAVVLRDLSTGDVIGHTLSDANGYFAFANIPLGTYEVIPDKYRVSVTNVPIVTVDAQQMVKDSLLFDLHEEWLELVNSSVAIVEPDLSLQLQAFPNPFRGSTQVQLDLSASARVDLVLVDIQGKRAQNLIEGELAAGTHRFVLGTALPAGIYFLRMRLGGTEKVIKISKLD